MSWVSMLNGSGYSCRKCGATFDFEEQVLRPGELVARCRRCGTIQPNPFPTTSAVLAPRESETPVGDRIKSLAEQPAPLIQDPICMTSTEAAEFVGVADRTIREWRTNGKLTVIENESGHLVFSKSTLDMLRASRRKHSVPST